MSGATAYCGLVCQTCPIYLATREENRAEQANMRAEIVRFCKKQYGLQFRLEDITDCDGCHTEGGRLFSACASCPIRSCARQKGLHSCAGCNEYACANLERFFSTEPDARKRLDEVRSQLH